MKLASTIARYLLGFAFTVFGLNGFFHFIPQPPPPAAAMQYMQAVATTGYLTPVFALQLLCGLLLLTGRFVPLALTILAAIIANILMYHLAMDPKGIGAGLFVALLWVLVFSGYRASFRALLRAQPEGL